MTEDKYHCCDCGKKIDYYKSKRCRSCWKNMSKIAWNRGKKMEKPPWNKGKKFPQYQGKNHYNWRGGKTIQMGYVYILSPGHPKAKVSKKNPNGYVAEHVLVMEKKIGRYLQGDECIHHVDGNKKNNKISNLILFHNNSEHQIACHPTEHIKNGKNKGKFKSSSN